MTLRDWILSLFRRPMPSQQAERAPEASIVPRQALQAGRQTRPPNSLGDFGWGSVPRRGAHAINVESIDVRRYSAQQLLDILADVSPDVSLALWNVLRLAGGRFWLTAMTPDLADADEAAQTELDALVGRLNARHGGLEALVDQWLYTLYLQGALAAELVLTKQRGWDVEDAIAVQPYTIEFRRDEAGVPRPYCRDRSGQWQALNETLFWYVPLDSPPDDPYGRAPASPAIGEVMFNIQLLVDLKRAVHTNAWGRLDVAIAREMVQDLAAKLYPGNATQQASWAEQQLAAITTAYNSLQPDDTFIHWDMVKVSSVDSSGKTLQIAPLIRVLELRTIRALKQLPVLMGSNEGTTETHGTVQFEIYAAGIQTLRNKVDWLVERMLTTALNVLGVQAAVVMEWDDIRSSDRLKDAQAELIEIENAANKVMNGWWTNEEAAMEIVGHEPVGEMELDDEEKPQGPAARGHRPRDRGRVRLLNTRSADDGPGDFVGMTAAERRVLRQGQSAVRGYFQRLGRAFPARQIAQAAVDAEPEADEGARALSPQEQNRLARIRRLVDDWFAAEEGRKMSDELHELVERHYRRVWNVEGAQALRQLGIGGTFRLRNEAVIRSLRDFGATRVVGIDDETKRRLAKVIADSLGAGNGVDQIARDVRRDFTDMSVRRSKLIAHTETGEQMGQANYETYRRNAVEETDWLTVGDDRVSELCQDNAAASPVPVGTPFPSGDYHPLGHPGCRCVSRARIPSGWMPPESPWRGA